MLIELRQKLLAGDAVVAGVLSGTSADGIDVAVFRPRFDRRRVLDLGVICVTTLEFERGLRGRVRGLLDADAGPDGAQVALGDLARLDADLGRAFGEAAGAMAEDCGVQLDLVGSHGQTFWHHSGGAGVRASLQLGDGDFVAEAAGCGVVSDFRSRDLAAGGEGAPIGALVDPWLFGERDLAVLNLGGFGNLTLMRGGEVVHNFDTGPAGALLDGVARRVLNAEFDRGGAAALAGVVDVELLEQWKRGVLGDFVNAGLPKSTGRDQFGERWVAGLLSDAVDASAENLCATAVELVAWSVGRGLEMVGWPPAQVAVCGGGVHNVALMNALGRSCSGNVISSREVGVDPDGREALIFGLLGAAHVLGIALPIGGERPMVLGKWSPGR